MGSKGEVLTATRWQTCVGLFEIVEGYVVKERFAVENGLFANHIKSRPVFLWQFLTVVGSSEHTHTDIVVTGNSIASVACCASGTRNCGDIGVVKICTVVVVTF